MQVVHPPLHKVSMYVDPGKRADVREVRRGKGVKFIELIKWAVEQCMRCDLSTAAVVSLAGGEKWMVFNRTVDEITGWEMLELSHRPLGSLGAQEVLPNFRLKGEGAAGGEGYWDMWRASGLATTASIGKTWGLHNLGEERGIIWDGAALCLQRQRLHVPSLFRQSR